MTSIKFGNLEVIIDFSGSSSGLSILRVLCTTSPYGIKVRNLIPLGYIGFYIVYYLDDTHRNTIMEV
jgi:hypothetical protein